ncbi:hypothetical protein C8J26_2623 [Sphingomonas aurantiaca]|uniref:Uncharacterized protein n=1 Tax=Sphingomonas aurantiaca TaxID=185949 RepID=A0A2T5GKD8_9SPHN|nr:hypothetical protein C8J26_2623 [Sphingomonas aurantiaca]
MTNPSSFKFSANLLLRFGRGYTAPVRLLSSKRTIGCHDFVELGNSGRDNFRKGFEAASYRVLTSSNAHCECDVPSRSQVDLPSTRGCYAQVNVRRIRIRIDRCQAACSATKFIEGYDELVVVYFGNHLERLYQSPNMDERLVYFVCSIATFAPSSNPNRGTDGQYDPDGGACHIGIDEQHSDVLTSVENPENAVGNNQPGSAADSQAQPNGRPMPFNYPPPKFAQQIRPPARRTINRLIEARRHRARRLSGRKQ